MSYQGRGVAARGDSSAAGRDTGDSPKPLRGPQQRLTSPCFIPARYKYHFPALEALGAAPVPPVPMEKGFYHKHLVNSCLGAPFLPGLAFIPRESIRKNKHSCPCAHTAPALPGCACQARGSQMVPEPQAWLGSPGGHKNCCKGICPLPFAL